MQRSFWKATADIWKRTAIRVITVCLGSGAAPVGHISADTLSTLFQKGSSMITASLQYRESSTAIGCLPWKTPLTKSIPVIMKSGNNCVSRRKNLFWRISGRGLTSKSPSGMRKQSGQVHSRESSATLQLTVSLLYQEDRINLPFEFPDGKIKIHWDIISFAC